MIRTNDIKRQIKKMQLDASAELDTKIDARFSNAPAKLDMKPPAEIQPNIWRIMMENPIIKYAAILVVAAIVLFSITVLTGRDTSSVENGMEITSVAELLEQLTNESVTLSEEAVIAERIDLKYNEDVPKDQALALIYSALEDAGFTAVQRDSGIHIIPAGSTDEPLMADNLSDIVFTIADGMEHELVRILFDDSLLGPGQHVEIRDSGNNEYSFGQVSTSEIGKSIDSFPAYACYIDFEIKSNVDLNLATERITRGSLFEHGQWDAYFTGSNRIIGNGDFTRITLCVCMWNYANDIRMFMDQQDTIASQITILIQPDE